MLPADEEDIRAGRDVRTEGKSFGLVAGPVIHCFIGEIGEWPNEGQVEIRCVDCDFAPGSNLVFRVSHSELYINPAGI